MMSGKIDDQIDVAYSERGAACRGDIRYPEPITADTVKVMMIHGGGWTGFSRNWQDGLAEDFCRRGFCTFNIDYRLAPETPWPGIGDDCLEAAEFFYRLTDGPAALRDRPIAVLGISAGGHLALMTGLRMAREKVNAIVSISGIADPDYDRTVHPERYARLFAGSQFTGTAFPEAYLRPDSPPVLLTHHVADPCVDIRSALAFAVRGAERNCPVSTWFYDRGYGDHDHAVWQPGVRPRILFADLADRVADFLVRPEAAQASLKISWE